MRQIAFELMLILFNGYHLNPLLPRFDTELQCQSAGGLFVGYGFAVETDQPYQYAPVIAYKCNKMIGVVQWEAAP